MHSSEAAQVLVAGSAHGPICVLDEPLSMWGGLDPATGSIIDVHHPQFGHEITGTIVVMSSGRGSSSASSVLAEAVRLGTAPSAFVLTEPDEILVLGALVSEELYGVATPILVVPRARHRQLIHGDNVAIASTGVITSM